MPGLPQPCGRSWGRLLLTWLSGFLGDAARLEISPGHFWGAMSEPQASVECSGAQCKLKVSHLPLFSAQLHSTLWLTGLLPTRLSLRWRPLTLPPSLGLSASEPARVAYTLGLQVPQCKPLTHAMLPEELEGSFRGLLCLHPYSER